MSTKKNFQVDGIGINAEHFANHKKADFVKEVLPGIPDRFGSEADKIKWAETAFDLMQKAFPVPATKA